MIIKRRVTRGFVQIANEVVRDRRLALDEHGLLHYLLSLPDDWEVNLKQIESYWKIGRDKRRRLFGALLRTGWARLERIESEDGAFLGKRWVISDEPGPEMSDEALADEDASMDAEDAAPTMHTTAAPESQTPDALVSGPDVVTPSGETPFQGVGSPDRLKTRPPEKASIPRRKTPDEYVEGKNTMARAREDGEEDLGEPPPGFGQIERLWPADHIVSPFACERVFARLTDAQKRAAARGIPLYLADCRSKGQTRLCDLRTYLDERRWERFANGRGSGRKFFLVQRGTPEAERWRAYLIKTAPARLPIFDMALNRSGFTAESQWPPPIDPDKAA